MSNEGEQRAALLLQTIEQIGREKNIEPEIIIAAIEEAMAVAAQKFYRTEDRLIAAFNRETGEVDLHAVKRVVDEVEEPTEEISPEDAAVQAKAAGLPVPDIGDDLRIPMPTDQLGRIAAQAAKQVIYQNLRDAERDNIYVEFVDRVGELVTGIVKRFERGDMIVDLGRTEALLPRREQSRAEHYNIGDRIRVVMVEVLRATRGPQVIVSRSSPELLRRLFEMEVPEIYDGTVVIKGAVREGGDRAKVAVHSNEDDVDPVGACVGMRGSRVQSIIRELRGEKIDIVEWDEEEHQFAINALKPARVNRVGEAVVVNDEGGEENRLEVIVDDDQLSLAIGKRGQNVRLAGKLLGRKIDVKSEEQKYEELYGPIETTDDAEAEAGDGTADAVEAETDGIVASDIPGAAPTGISGIDVEKVPGVGPKAAESLREVGLGTAEAVAEAGEDGLLAVPGIGPKTALKIAQAAEELVAAGAEANGQEPDAEEEQIQDEPATAASHEADAEGASPDESESEPELA